LYGRQNIANGYWMGRYGIRQRSCLNRYWAARDFEIIEIEIAGNNVHIFVSIPLGYTCLGERDISDIKTNQKLFNIRRR